MVNKNAFFVRIYYPVFPYSGVSVQIQFENIVMAGIAWRNNLDNPVRGSGTATVCKLVLVTDNAYVRLYYGASVFPQLDSKWSRIDTAGTSL